MDNMLPATQCCTASSNIYIHTYIFISQIQSLGLELDKHMNWKNHMKKLLPKLISASFFVKSVTFHSQNGLFCILSGCSGIL